jgi:hypothetical protein
MGLLAERAQAVTSACDAVAGNLVANCGFENGVYSSTIGGNTNPSVPTGWTPSAGYDLESGFNNVESAVVHTGSYSLQIGNDDGQAVPMLSQTLTDVSGANYSGSIYVYYGGAGTTDTNPFFNVSIDGSPVLALNYLAPGTYTEYNFSFTGSGSDILSIGGNTSPSEWFVDDISITGAVATTPLASTWTMLIAGFVGLGFSVYSGMKKNAAAIATA